MDLVEEYYKKALSEIEKGVSINKLYQILYEFEKNEEYKACAGILKAINPPAAIMAINNTYFNFFSNLYNDDSPFLLANFSANSGNDTIEIPILVASDKKKAKL